MGNALLVITL